MAKRRKKRVEQDEAVRLFAARLKKVRNERGMSQLELGRRANVTASYVWRLENAGASPGIDLVARLAAALGTTTHDLLPAEPLEDTSAVAREQARRLFESVMQKVDAHALAVLNPLLAMFLESAGKRG